MGETRALLQNKEKRPGTAREAMAKMMSGRQGRGNVELSSFYTHVVASVALGLYAVARPIAFGDNSTASIMLTLYTASAGLVCAVSSAFHTYRTVSGWGNWMRSLDYTAIYIGLFVSNLSDVALVSDDFASVRWQSIADVVAPPLCLCVFFAVRRMLIPWGETMKSFADSTLVHRMQHEDLEHAPLRMITSAFLTLQFINTIPAALLELPKPVAERYVALSISAYVLLWAGQLYDASMHVRTAWYCELRACGVWDSHATWHVVSAIGIALNIAAREMALSYRTEP